VLRGLAARRGEQGRSAQIAAGEDV
jgi:hypothetical protein